MPRTSKYEVKISHYAFINLEEIYHYIAFIDFRPLTASEVVSAIENKILNDISSFPFYFPECPARRTKRKSYRQALCKNYKIIFKIEITTILIIGIVHSSRSRSFVKRIPLK
jgi:plasmid stabilization system protein ParE